MNKNIVLIGIVVVVILGISSWALVVNSPTPQPENSQVIDNESKYDFPEVNQTANQKEFIVTGKNFSFTPSALTVQKGDRVTITFKNADGFHDLKIDEFAVATKRISGGQQESVEFIADKTGTFEYYCSVANHRAMGMKGALTVTE